MPSSSNLSNTNAWLAGLLSFLLPGLGQVFNRRVLAGAMWFVVVGIGYFVFFVPGVILHALCILCAFLGANKGFSTGQH